MAATQRVRWYGELVERALLAEMQDRVLRCCTVTKEAIKRSMVKSGRTASGLLVTKALTSKTGKTYHRKFEPTTGQRAAPINTFRSQPGEVPRVQTGRLLRSIDYELHKVLPMGRVGPKKRGYYGKFLELGTKRGHLKKRPFIVPAVRGLRAVYAKIMSARATGRTKLALGAELWTKDKAGVEHKVANL